MTIAIRFTDPSDGLEHPCPSHSSLRESVYQLYVYLSVLLLEYRSFNRFYFSISLSFIYNSFIIYL